jgi:hypothetical protein
MMIVPTFFLQGVLWCFRLGNVDYSVYVERDLLCVCAPMFVAEAVCPATVLMCFKGVVAVRD